MSKKMTSRRRSFCALAWAAPLALWATAAQADNYALIIGIDQYKQSQRINSLDGATNDARALAKTLEDVAGFPAANIHLLVSGGQDQPTGANITAQLTELAKQVKSGDTLFLLYSGHGIDLDGTSYLVPWDADAQSEDTLRSTVLPTSTLRALLAKIPAKTLLMAFDMCRTDPRKGSRDLGSNNLLGPNQARDLRIVPAGDRTGGPQEVITLFACSEGERSWEWTDKGRGFFSYYLEQGLRRDAADEQGVVHASNLVSYLQKAVYGAVQKQEGEAQTPFPLIEGKDKDAAGVILATGLAAGTGGATAVTVVDPSTQGRYDAALQQGFELLEQQRWPDAQAKFQTALTLQPSSAKAADGLGRTYRAQNDNGKAEIYFRQAVKSDPASSPFATDLADTLYARGDVKDAEPLYRTAISLDPNAEAPVLSLAALEHKAKRDDDAEQLLRQAMQINPKDPHPWDRLGDLYSDKNDYATAEGNYRKAVSLDTFGGQYLAHLARCLVKEGKIDEARSVADQARGLGVSVPDSLFNSVDTIKNKVRIPSIGGFHF